MPTEGLEPGFLASRLVLDTREPEFESMYRHIFFFICDWCVLFWAKFNILEYFFFTLKRFVIKVALLRCAS